jgi:di/tricarboxylate transporter
MHGNVSCVLLFMTSQFQQLNFPHALKMQRNALGRAVSIWWWLVTGSGGSALWSLINGLTTDGRNRRISLLAMIMIVIVTVLLLTEIMSNILQTTNNLVPVFCSNGVGFMKPIIATNPANNGVGFMIPVANGGNAIIYSGQVMCK